MPDRALRDRLVEAGLGSHLIAGVWISLNPLIRAIPSAQASHVPHRAWEWLQLPVQASVSSPVVRLAGAWAPRWEAQVWRSMAGCAWR